MSRTDPPAAGRHDDRAPAQQVHGHGPGHHHYSAEELHNEDVAHEESDVNVRTILLFAAGLAVVTMFAAALISPLPMHPELRRMALAAFDHGIHLALVLTLCGVLALVVLSGGVSRIAVMFLLQAMLLMGCHRTRLWFARLWFGRRQRPDIATLYLPRDGSIAPVPASRPASQFGSEPPRPSPAGLRTTHRRGIPI